ncbi:NadR type nicotinamide-nucleotide adenylyltransferase [Mycobacterium sp. OAS707]|uniref:AAA family ATPase n=1 Tax=Mycobacterium sp. OAS707 TaxID=2663822 RepID=UPI00178A1992|nr:AAA family ATPase [Mycobacterium sp. OAS707]MBE1548119.1 NadR type nicotinamide-nucleotide adenylyltransferase [Mycobacterium sp. OAS707]
MSAFDHGLLIGKFYPPHLGHHAGIRAAAARCRRFTVLVMSAAVESIPLEQRVSWLREEHRSDANVRVLGVRCDAPLDVTDEQVWTAQVAVMQAALRCGCAPAVDAVFCGDDYGDELASRFGATAVRLDRYGSSTAVRRDLASHWGELAPATRAGLTTRVIVVGAESTGTTTVAQELAAHYQARGGVWANTRCVREYGREYTEIKHRRQGGQLRDLVWERDDFDVVAAEQTRQEEKAARVGSPLLVCDTDAFATALWERRYLAAAARTGQMWTRVPPRAVYLVTDHQGVPWEDDGWREGDLELRAAMTQWFIDALTLAGHSWVLLTGDLSQRVDLAIRTVDPLLHLRAKFGEPLHGPGFEGT